MSRLTSLRVNRISARFAALFAVLVGISGIAADALGQPPGRGRDPGGYGRNDFGWFDVSFFYEELAPYGEWIEHRQFGWVWTPYDIPFTWRPYTRGSWAFTDCGWTWLSYEPFGWAVYHYGRWYWDPYYGWLWVPGTQWSPAWVAWRFGQGWVGWAPLPPDVGAWNGDQFSCQPPFARPIRNFYWNFVPARHFCAEPVLDHIVRVNRNVNLARITLDVTSYARTPSRIINRCFGPDRIQPYLRQPIPSYRLVDRDLSRYARPPSDPRAGRSSSHRVPVDVARKYEVQGRDIVAFKPPLRDGNPRQSPRDIVTGGGTRPPGVPPTSSDWQKRWESEKRALSQRLENEKAALARRQAAEQKRQPDYMKSDDVPQWHNAERAALEEQFEREQQLLERYYQRIQQGKVGVQPPTPRRYRIDEDEKTRK